jgi:hypothetical protein
MTWALSRWSTPVIRWPARALDGSLAVVDEDRVLRFDVEAVADQAVDGRIGLSHAALVRVDENVGHVLEAVALPFLLAGTHEAVAQDRGGHAMPEPTGVLDQGSVRRPEVVVPEIRHEQFDVLRGHAQLAHEGLAHLLCGEQAEGSAAPDLVHALVEFAGSQARGLLPPLAEPGGRGHLEHASDIEDHRVQHVCTLSGRPRRTPRSRRGSPRSRSAEHLLDDVGLGVRVVVHVSP